MKLKRILLAVLIFGLINIGHTQSDVSSAATDVHLQQTPKKQSFRTELKAKAEAGDISSLIAYTKIVLYGVDTPSDWSEIYNLLIKAHDAKKLKATFYLFLLHLNKGNLEQGINPYYDLDKAINYLELAAQRGSEAAQRLLASLYKNGYSYGLTINIDPIKALAWQVNSIFQGSNEIVLNNIYYKRSEFIYENVKAISKEDQSKIFNLIEEYAQLYPVIEPLGYPYNSSERAQNEQFIKNKMDEQLKLRAKAYSGTIGAMIAYGGRMMQGEFGVVDWDEVHKLFTKVRALGSSVGTHYLYILHVAKGDENKGFNPYYDPDKAIKYLELAAKEGNDSAQNLMAGLYERGYGAALEVEKDLFKGTAWRINVFFEGKNERTIVGTRYIRSDFIEQLLKERFVTEEDRSKAREMIEEYARLYPIKEH